MNYDESIYKEKANRRARKIWLIFAILLSANYGSDTANGLRTGPYYLTFFTSMLDSVYYRTNSIKSKRYVNRLVQIWNCRWIWYLLFLCTDYQPIQHCIYLHTAGNQSFGFIQKPEIYDSIRRCQCVNHHSQCSC